MSATRPAHGSDTTDERAGKTYRAFTAHDPAACNCGTCALVRRRAAMAGAPIASTVGRGSGGGQTRAERNAPKRKPATGPRATRQQQVDHSGWDRALATPCARHGKPAGEPCWDTPSAMCSSRTR